MLKPVHTRLLLRPGAQPPDPQPEASGLPAVPPERPRHPSGSSEALSRYSSASLFRNSSANTS